MTDGSAKDGGWFGAGDAAALADLVRLVERRSDASAAAPAGRSPAPVDPEATRALLSRAATGHVWTEYESALRRQARRAARQGLDFASLEAAFGRLVPDVAPLLVAELGDNPRRLVAALDVLNRLMLRELWVLGREYRAAGEPARGGERTFAPALDALGDGVIATDDHGLVTRMNLAAQQLVGWTAEEARGRPLDDIYQRVDDETRVVLPSRIDEVLQRGRVLSLPRYPILIARDGSNACALVESLAPIVGEDGAIEGAMLVFRDEHRERAHGQALEASQARTAAIIEASADAVVTIDEDGAISDFNGAAERLFGYDRDAVIGLGFADLILPQNLRAAYAEAVARDLATGETRVLGKRSEMMALRSDGTEFPVEAVVARIPVEGAVSFTCFLRDLTAAKRAEQAVSRSHQQLRALAGRVEAAREEERTRIARELHDELGQQLTAIRMDLGWLVHRKKVLPVEVCERVDAMSQLVETTFQMVRRLGTELRPGILDDLGLAAAIEWQAREFEGRSGIRVDVEAPAEVGSLDPRYATAIFRIFQEVLTNVGRHSEAKKVRARLWQEDSSVQFEVRDDGRGIRPEEAANANSLGLLGMRERASLLGGAFLIEAQPKGGTIVRVTLPREVQT